MMLDLPLNFIQTIQNTFHGEGKRWLKAFPNLLEEAVQRWGLTDIRPVPNLSYNFVAFATGSPLTPGLSPQRGERSIVLKLGVPQRELTSEITALRFYDGRGICRLLDADAEKGMLLLERLEPGRMLATVRDDEHATRIAVDVMRQLWRPVPENQEDLIQLKDWFDGFKRLHKRFNGGTGPLPKRLVETAESLSTDLLAENKDETLLHGDFHHFNVLESARGWLAIDPKGVIGPRGYEVGPLLTNPVPDFLNGSNPRAQTTRRIAILSEQLGMERENIRDWAICHTVLSAWWSVEDKDDWRYAIHCAEIIQQA